MSNKNSDKDTAPKNTAGESSDDGDSSAPNPLSLKIACASQKTKRLNQRYYEKELKKLHVKLVKLQQWIRHKGLRVVVLFEGRDAAGKGGVIKRITECLNPRVCRVVALGTPSEREKTQWYFQRYVARTCQRPARWSCLTAVGTTGPVSNA